MHLCVMMVLWSIMLLHLKLLVDHLLKTELFVTLQGQEHTIFTECDLKIISEVAEFVPLSHLSLSEGAPNVSNGVLVKPFGFNLRL